ncbi:NAD(P)-dependent oxidoreductase [Desulfurococcaceae archaeon MEX13E-LK6-19]|nr:NAD(P)-dependent oxidoreductase [Desulfurococcaceae archaeon MEX13E-LK6-19]
MMNEYMEYKVGIVGGSGYIGFELARYLSNFIKVKIIDIKPPINLPANIEYVYGDVRDYNSIKKALKDVDVVVHSAIIQIPRINKEKKLGYEVNVIGTQNVCKVTEENERIKGMVLTGTWHVFGEREITGIINEEFGYRPDKVEERAKLYALSKVIQESIVRFYDEMSEKVFGVIRLGTVLGERMPEKTAANIFINNGLKGKPLTPYKHSMYRPMLYIDINDVCRAFKIFIDKILNEEFKETSYHIINLVYPEPVTIIELAEIIKEVITEITNGKISPPIQIVDKGLPMMFSPEDKKKFQVDLSKLEKVLGIKSLISVKDSIRRIISSRLRNTVFNIQ